MCLCFSRETIPWPKLSACRDVRIQLSFQVPSSVSLISDTTLDYSESPYQALPKPIDTSACSVLILINPSSALQFFWESLPEELHQIQMSSMQEGIYVDYTLVLAKPNILGCSFQTCFLPTAFQNSLLEITGKPVGLCSVQSRYGQKTLTAHLKTLPREKEEHRKGQYQKIGWTHPKNAAYGFKRSLCLLTNTPGLFLSATQRWFFLNG